MSRERRAGKPGIHHVGILVERSDDVLREPHVLERLVSRFVAEDDIVVVECKGDVATKLGARYDNDYCYVCRFDEGGALLELTEYMDTALAERVLSAPG